MIGKCLNCDANFELSNSAAMDIIRELTDLKAKYEKCLSALKFYSSGEFPWSKDSEYDNGEMADSTLEELGEK